MNKFPCHLKMLKGYGLKEKNISVLKQLLDISNVNAIYGGCLHIPNPNISKDVKDAKNSLYLSTYGKITILIK